MPATPLLLPIFKLARSPALPFVPIRPLQAPAAVAPSRSDIRASAGRNAQGLRRIAS